jgi:putative ABC transport system substrate-binding protein
VRRREFITLLGNAAVAWPLAARAQQAARMKRVGVLLPASREDSEYPSLLRAFVQALKQLGWTDGTNVQIVTRWAGGRSEGIRKAAMELAALVPDVILGPGNASVGPLLQVTRTVPIVFVIVPDPVGAGFVNSLARPGGNATGFTSFEYDIGGKWLELLKEAVPNLARVGVLRDANIAAGVGQWSAIQTAASAFGVDATPLNLGNADEVTRVVGDFARIKNGGLILTSSALALRDRDLIVELAAQHQLPALYYARAFVTSGGLMSYGSSRIDQFQHAATYVDRILRGERPSDLPVQAPTKYELVINLKTAKVLGLTVPPTLLARADEVIE